MSQPYYIRPYRSVLYVPASNERAMEKARDLRVDAIIFDLEDAVTPSEKEAARDKLAQVLLTDFGDRAKIVRINGLETPWWEGDARAFAYKSGADAILLPKVNGPEDLDKIAAIIPDTHLWAMIETPDGVLHADEIASHDRLEAMVMGTNDLLKDLNGRFRSDRQQLQYALGKSVMAAKARRRVIVDGVFNAFKDEIGLRRESEQGRDFGFDGKTIIHPAQVDTVNEVFAPTAAEVDLAHRQINAFVEAEGQGKGVAVVDGQIVESLHVEMARTILDRANAIAAMAAE